MTLYHASPLFRIRESSLGCGFSGKSEEGGRTTRRLYPEGQWPSRQRTARGARVTPLCLRGGVRLQLTGQRGLNYTRLL